jgi:Tfp pilus assembly protein PilN
MSESTTTKGFASFASNPAQTLTWAWSGLGKILAFNPLIDVVSPKNNMSVSIETGTLSIAYGERSFSRVTIKGTRNYVFEEGKYPQPNDLVASLAKAVREFRITESDVTLSIPKAWTVIRIIEFPSTIKENISEAISHELDRITPYHADEALFDFKILKEFGDRLLLLVIATQADRVRPYLDAAAKYGFNIRKVTNNLASFGTIGHYTYDTSDTVYLHATNTGLEGGLFINGMIVQTASDTFVADSPDVHADQISAQVTSLVRISEQWKQNSSVRVILRTRSEYLMELLKDRLAMHVQFIGEHDAESRIQDASMPFTAACGSALQSLWPKAASYNLLLKGVDEKEKTPTLLTKILSVFIGAALVLYFLTPLWMTKEKLENISGQIASIKNEALAVESLKNEAEQLSAINTSINGFRRNRIMKLDVLKELTGILPQTTWLYILKTTDDTVEMSGLSASVSELLPKLESSPYFSNVEFASPTFRDKKTDLSKFTIKMQMERSEKQKGASDNHAAE